MSAKQLLHPASAALLDRIARAKRPAFHTLTPEQARLAYAVGAEILDFPKAPLAHVQDIELPGGQGQPLRARRYRASTQPSPGLLYFHGGGFVIGNLQTHDSLCRQLALRSGATVIALDYRLAPEHPFPAAQEDTWAAMLAVSREPARYGVSQAPLALAGDSAGGTLAAVAALHARDIGLPLALQLLITPGTTAHADTPSHQTFANGFLIDREAIEWFFNHTIAKGQRADWRFAPLLADDLDGVCPAYVLLAECDPLVDEGLAYADRLRAAGVDVALDLVRGVTHDFIKLSRAVPHAEPALATCSQALREALNILQA